MERNLAWRVVVVDDHAIVRRSLRELIELSPAWECCGESDSAAASRRVTQGLNPDVVNRDVSMPGMGGTAAARAIHAALPNVRIVLHTLHKSAALIRTGLTAGATGYVVKTDPGNEMLATLEAVMRGEVYVTPSFGPELIAAIAKKISEKKRAAPESAIPDS